MVKLQGSFGVIPEGQYVLKIVGVKATPRVNPSTIAVTFMDENDVKFENKYNLESKGGAGAYFYLTKALGINAYEDHDEQAMVGSYVMVEVIHNHVVGKKDGKDLIYPNIKQVIEQVKGFDDEAEDEIDDDEPF